MVAVYADKPIKKNSLRGSQSFQAVFSHLDELRICQYPNFSWTRTTSNSSVIGFHHKTESPRQILSGLYNPYIMLDAFACQKGWYKKLVQ